MILLRSMDPRYQAMLEVPLEADLPKKTKKKMKTKKLLNQVDEALMDMASAHYETAFLKLAKSKRSLSEDRKLALLLGKKALERLNEVKASLIKRKV